MNIFKGYSISEGVATGPVRVRKDSFSVHTKSIPLSPEQEIRNYNSAYQHVESALSRSLQKAQNQIGEDAGAIFSAQLILLQDPELKEFIFSKIQQDGLSAAAAVEAALDYYRQQFSELTSPELRARFDDLADILTSLLHFLSNHDSTFERITEPVILCATSILPGELLAIPRKYLLGLVLEQGSVGSHVAILARSMHLPVLMDITPQTGWDGREALLDAENSTLIIDPDEETKLSSLAREEQRLAEQKALSIYKNEPSITPYGQKCLVYANAGSLSDLDSVLDSGSEGIGLLRTEFLFMEASSVPSQEEQYETYTHIASAILPRPLIIRTVDIGSDKQPVYLDLPKEANPALGIRGVRLNKLYPSLLYEQISAILRANRTGNISIMFPMIISEDEILTMTAIIRDVARTLAAEKHPFTLPKLGAMIETPAAALMCSTLCRHLDFVSIGTNDLIQYTLACDRESEYLRDYAPSHHPAILKLISSICSDAHEAGCKVEICGEMAGDLSLLDFYLDAGIDILSVSPDKVLKVRKAIREHKLPNA